MSDKIPTSVELLDRARTLIAQREGLPILASDNRLARELGVSQQAIWAIRKGRTTMGATVAAKLAGLLQVNPAWVLTCIQAERAQNVGLRTIWTEAAKKLAICLICLGMVVGMAMPHPAQAGIYPVYTLCAVGVLLLSWLLGHPGRRWAMVLGLLSISLSGCAEAPSYQGALDARAAELTATFNAAHGTDYPVPPIRWSRGGCSRDGDIEGEAAGWWTATAAGVTHRYFVGVVTLNLDCPANLVVTNNLPHELCHVFMDRLYGEDVDHDRPWQDCALELGIPRTDPWITLADLKAGGQ